MSLLINSSCVTYTDKLWAKKRDKFYNETIKAYLISSDGEKMVFLGEKYHYIFDDTSGAVKQLLQWDGKQKLVISVYNFEATSENEVDLFLLVESASPKELSDRGLSALSTNEINFLKKLGFLDRKSNSTSMFKRIHMSGTRFIPRTNTNYVSKSSLSREYKVQIKIGYDSFLDKKSTKIALTPVTVVGDTIIIATGLGGVIILSAILLPLLVVGHIVGGSIDALHKSPHKI